MGTYLSIPFTSRKVLQVEPSPKLNADGKRDDLEVKNGEWVCGGKDPAEVKPLTAEDIADLSRPLTPYEIDELVQRASNSMTPIYEETSEEEKKEEEKKEEEKKEEEKKEEEKKEEPAVETKPTLLMNESLREKELTDSMELIRKAMKIESIEHPQKEVVDKMDVIEEEPKALTINVNAPRIPEFQPNANSASHAIKKFNRRHRKH